MSGVEKTSGLALQGLRVLELSTVVAAPTAARMLCAYGAEVIKVEALRGDDLRRVGLTKHVPCEDTKNPMFTVHNSNKRLVALNIKTRGGREALLKLLETADVFITNVREPSLARMGLDYASLQERYPRLVYAQFYGYGPKGPASEDPGFDSTAFWMRSGPVADWTEEGSKPFYPTYAFGDMATSSVFLSGILVALYARERTGRGTKVSTSLFASGIWCNATGVVSTQFETKHLNPDYSHPPSPFDGFYACAGGSWIAVYTNEYGRDRAKFARELGMEDILTDRRWDSVQALEESGFFREAAARVAAVFQTKSAAAWRDQLSRASISCEVMQRTCDVIRDEQALANDYIEPVDFGDGLRVMMPSPPLSFSAYHRRPTANSGRIGADTDAVLEELGYRREEICALRDEGAIL